jgi:threonine aldolase
MRRRNFLATPLAAYQLGASEPPKRIYALGDGLRLTPAEYSELLASLMKPGTLAADSYSIGGVVEQLETRMAALLGKETAVWLPTGTLANHLAVRLLAGSRRRVLVQAESHLFNDCGDCAQTLSGLHLVQLAPGRATFTLEEVERAAYDSTQGRVVTPIGAIQIETPVRRRQGERFAFEDMTKIASWARERKVGLHLDGARLFLESVYTRRPLKEYAALFDTVYISMYKYFNAASGAILAGPKALLADLFQTRRMFGGGLSHVWPFAAVALHYLEGFEERFRAGAENGEKVVSALSKDIAFGVERIPNGTNIFRMRVFTVNTPVYRERLDAMGISTSEPTGDWFPIQVNETWGHVSASEIVTRFHDALG